MVHKRTVVVNSKAVVNICGAQQVEGQDQELGKTRQSIHVILEGSLSMESIGIVDAVLRHPILRGT